MKKNRFLKWVILYSLLMATVITLTFLAICWRVGEINGTVAATMCSMWSVELTMGAWIKKADLSAALPENTDPDEGI